MSLWFCTVFLLRHWILLILVLASSITGVAGVQWAYAALTPTVLVLQAPMWLLVVAWARRLPQAGAGARWLWRHGREIITLTAVLNLGWAAALLWDREIWNPWPERFMLIVAMIELFVIAGVWRSALYRQLFSEFPAKPEATPS